MIVEHPPVRLANAPEQRYGFGSLQSHPAAFYQVGDGIRIVWAASPLILAHEYLHHLLFVLESLGACAGLDLLEPLPCSWVMGSEKWLLDENDVGDLLFVEVSS